MAKRSETSGAQRVREEGQALVEYSLIFALIAIVAVAGLTALGGDIDGLYGVVEGVAKAMSDSLSG